MKILMRLYPNLDCRSRAILELSLANDDAFTDRSYIRIKVSCYCIRYTTIIICVDLSSLYPPLTIFVNLGILYLRLMYVLLLEVCSHP